MTCNLLDQDYKAAMHVDKNNLGPSYIIGLGDSSIFIDSSVFFFRHLLQLKATILEVGCGWMMAANWVGPKTSGAHMEWTQVDAS